MKITANSLFLIGLAAVANGAEAAAVIYESAGTNAAAITSTVNDFRNALGTLNANDGNHQNAGRREINWDGVPAGFTDPNPFPGDFFNSTTVPGRARGALFTTPGSGFLVNNNNFGYPADFIPFSPTRLFAPVGSNITDVSFFLPGTTRQGTVSGFGAVFSDVEIAGLTKIEFYDAFDNILLTRDVLVAGNGGLSFLGVKVDGGDRISRVRITTGDIVVLGGGNFSNGTDTVVMDDFIYGEPVPAPASFWLLGAGGMAWRMRRRG